METRPAVHSRLYQDYFTRQASRSELMRHMDEETRNLHHPVLVSQQKGRQSSNVLALQLERVHDPVREDMRLMLPLSARKSAPEEPQTSHRKAAPISHREVTSLFEMRDERSSTARATPATLRPVDPPLLAYKPKFGISQLRKETKPIIGKYYAQLTPVKQTLSFSSGCNVQKILQSGKEMVSYSDPKAMYAALSQPR